MPDPRLKIKIPGNNISERVYIVRTLFVDFLGIDVEITPVFDADVYTIYCPGKIVEFKDHFFAKNNIDKLYTEENLPQKSIEISFDFLNQNNLICLWGTGGYKENKHIVHFDFDVFASAFFMLARWEETLPTSKDKHGRFTGSQSIAYKNRFLHRAIVNEYADFLWEVVVYCGFKGARKKHHFQIIPTHDIDSLEYWNAKRKKDFLKNIVADVFIRHKPKLALRRIISLFQTLKNNEADPSNVFDYFIAQANRYNLKARFYFIAGGNTVYEKHYKPGDALAGKIFTLIAESGHIIGFHPSYKSFNDPKQFQDELKLLVYHSGCKISEGRQHYLRFDVPLTWRIWNQAGLTTDSTMHYTGYPGFRCGTCYEFPVFDIQERKGLELMERPLIVMDTDFAGKSSEHILKTICELKEQVKKHEGKFIFLWHNDKVNTPEWFHLKPIFEKAFYEK